MNTLEVDFSFNDNRLYLRRSRELEATLTNKKGAVVPLTGTIQLCFPPLLFTEADVAGFEVHGLPDGWLPSAAGFVLELRPPPGAELVPGTPLRFTLAKLQASRATAAAGVVVAKFRGLDVWPTQVACPLSLERFPTGEPKDLKQSLVCELEDRVVYRTYDLAAPVLNSLVLVVRNLTKDPLVTEPWGDAPPALSITVVTGEGPGALTRESLAADSPLGIKLGMHEQTGSMWTVDDPEQLSALCWTASPSPDVNRAVLGKSENTSVSFELRNIVTVLPAGHTQLYVQLSNVPGYADCLFALDVEKRDPVAGVLSFGVDEPNLTRGETAHLNWATFAVSKLVLEYVEDDVLQRVQNLPLNPLEAVKSFPITPKVTTTYTLRAYDLRGLEVPRSEQLTITVLQPAITIRALTAAPNPPDFSRGAVNVKFEWAIDNLDAAEKVELDPFGVMHPAATSFSALLGNSTTAMLRVYRAGGRLADAKSLQVPSFGESLVGKTYTFQAAGKGGFRNGSFATWAKRYTAQFISPYRMTLTMGFRVGGESGTLFVQGDWSLRDAVIRLEEQHGGVPWMFSVEGDGLLLLRQTPSSKRHGMGYLDFSDFYSQRAGPMSPLPPPPLTIEGQPVEFQWGIEGFRVHMGISPWAESERVEGI